MKKFVTFLCVACLCVCAHAQSASTVAQQLVVNITDNAVLNSEQEQQVKQIATTYITNLQNANLQNDTDDALVEAKTLLHQSFQSQLQQILTEEQYSDWQQSRRQRSETPMVATLATTNNDCHMSTSSSISRWESNYVPVEGEIECWTVDLNVNRPIKFNYTIDLETVSAVDVLQIYEVNSDGSERLIWSRSATAETGAITTTIPSGKAKVEYQGLKGNCNGTFKGFRLTYAVVNDPDIVDQNMYIVGKVGIGTTQPKAALHVNGSIYGGESNGALKLESQTGYVTIGASGSANMAISTDRTRFFFNKPIRNSSGIYDTPARTNLQLQANGNTRMTLLWNNGNVGIGTTTPAYKLDVNGTIRANQIVSTSNVGIGTTTPAYMLDVNGTMRANQIVSTSNVGIGTTTPNYLLDVNGTIRANEILVNSGSADFVFADDYNLRSLSEVHQFIQEHKHLPEIQSAEQMEKNGVSVNELQIQLLQKIEELTLYLIQQEQTIQNLQQQVEQLKK